MSKLIITKKDQAILTALADGRKILQLGLEPLQEKAALNSIYIGKVQNVRKNINSAFIEIGGGIIGYYSLSDNPLHLFADGTWKKDLRQGDEILVQVARDAVKTKALVLTGRLSFTGKLAVLTAGKTVLAFPARLAAALLNPAFERLWRRWIWMALASSSAPTRKQRERKSFWQRSAV